MIVKYFANDGTEFESEDDCELYEQTIAHHAMPLMWNGNEIPMTLDDFIKDYDSIGDVAFVLFHNKEEYENFCYWSDYFGYEAPDFYGERADYPKRFYYDDRDADSGYWCDLDEEIRHLQDIQKFFEKGA